MPTQRNPGVPPISAASPSRVPRSSSTTATAESGISGHVYLDDAGDRPSPQPFRQEHDHALPRRRPSSRQATEVVVPVPGDDSMVRRAPSRSARPRMLAMPLQSDWSPPSRCAPGSKPRSRRRAGWARSSRLVSFNLAAKPTEPPACHETFVMASLRSRKTCRRVCGSSFTSWIKKRRRIRPAHTVCRAEEVVLVLTKWWKKRSRDRHAGGPPTTRRRRAHRRDRARWPQSPARDGVPADRRERSRLPLHRPSLWMEIRDRLPPMS